MGKKLFLEDDLKEPVVHLIEHRVPWLTLGLMGGIIATIITSYFEKVISSNLSLAFFIPVIVYMSDAVGTQTETIYIRSVVHGQKKFSTYLFKESILGLALGILFGLILGGFAFFWLKSLETALAVGLAMFVNTLIAPVMAIAIPALLQREHTDPALGAGPFTTVLQDLLSLLVYFVIAAVIIFN